MGSLVGPWNIQGFILETAAQQGIPAIFVDAFYVEQSGGLASYGPDAYASGKQAARLVDKILKGTKPARSRWRRTQKSNLSSI